MGEEERERGGVCGDPVGSTDPEVSRISHPCTKWRAKMPLSSNPGVKRQAAAHFWRLTPASCPFLALNASLVPFSGVKRPEWCQTARLTPILLPLLALKRQ